jgi:two-component system LytT family response regulator
MIRAIIVEDEKMSRETLRRMLEKYCPQVDIVAEADGYRAGAEAIRKNEPDVVFLDIQMPDGSGFRLLEEFDEVNFEVIFTTAFDQFAIKAIKFSALDYLLKPIIPQELINAIEKVEQKRVEARKSKNIEVFLENIKSKEDNTQKIILSTSDKIHVIQVDEIIRCESDNYYTQFFFTNGKRLIVSKTLKENEEMLSQHNFIRPHKSHLINVKYIKSFLRQEGGYIIMTDGSKIPVSRRKREKIMDVLMHL